MSLRRRFALALLVTAVPLVAIGLVVAIMVEDELEHRAQESLGLLTNLEADRMQSGIVQRDRQSDLIARSPEVAQTIQEHLAQPTADTQRAFARPFQQLGDSVRGFRAAAVIDAGGQVVLGLNEIAEPVEYADLTRRGQQFAPFREVTNGDVRMATLSPIDTADGRLTLVVEWDLAVIVGPRRAADRATLDTALVQILADDQLRMAAPVMDRGQLSVVDLQIGQDGYHLAMSSLSNSDPTIESVGHNGEPVVAGLHHIEPTAWGVVISRPTAEAYAGLDRARNTVLGAFGLAMVGAFVVTLALTDPITRRLGRMAEAAELVAAGSVHRRLDDDSKDEIGRLSRAQDEVGKQLAFRIHHDFLTGLPNRQTILEQLDQSIEDGRSVSILFCDLDGFKDVNDRYGHLTGDRILCRAVARFRDCLPPSATLGRFGGDEFLVLCDRMDFKPAELALRLVGALAPTFRIDGDEVRISASVGIAHGSRTADSAQLLRQADVAVYRAKELGRGQVVVADAEVLTAVENRIQIMTDLRRALDRDELLLEFQPIVEATDGRIVGAEALVRWEHPRRGRVMPNEFVGLAADAGLSPMLDDWVLNRACRQLRTWREADPLAEELTLSVNLSSAALAIPDLHKRVARHLQHYELPPDRLRVEVTEGTIGLEFDAAVSAMHELRAIGVGVAIDDFGTGHSSLDRLRHMPVDVIKIDRSFVINIATDEIDRVMVETIVAMATALGLHVVAEGVEDDAQWASVRDIGCHHIQGYRFSKPVSGAQLLQQIRGAPTESFAEG